MSSGDAMTGHGAAGAGGAAGAARELERWFPRTRPALATPPALRLFCLPYAGGGAAVFRSWPQELPPTIEVRPIQLPGRENRIGEEPARRIADLVPLIADKLAPLLDRPFALFGHSMGALTAYGLTLELATRGAPAPVMLIVSARRAPHLPPTRPPVHDLPDADFMGRLHELGGTPPEVIANPELMALFGPVLRADFALNDSFRPIPAPRVACPLAVFGADDDSEVTPESLAAWREVAGGPFTLRRFDGSHFFLGTAQGEVLRAIWELLRPAVYANRGDRPPI
jgi:medium-chain acyl-[acyl-carrier-protein] hydrolase